MSEVGCELAKEVVAKLDDLTDVVKGAGTPLSGDLRMGVRGRREEFLERPIYLDDVIQGIIEICSQLSVKPLQIFENDKPV
jgi:hypothetical protein